MTIHGTIEGVVMEEDKAEAFIAGDRAAVCSGIEWFKSAANSFRNAVEKRFSIAQTREDLPDHPIRAELTQAIVDLIKVASFPVRARLELMSKRLEDMNGTSSTSKGPTQGFIAQFEKTKVAKGMWANIRYRPLVSFRPMCLEIPREIRKYFQIIDVAVNKNSQLLSAVPIPAAVFSKEDGTPVLLKMDVAKPGCDIVLSVTNIDSVDREFEATMFGQVEERC
jgi:hypothetical protein